MDENLKEALDLLLYAHAVIWTHFDPGMDQGDKKQPKEIKALLKQIRAELEKHGMDMEGTVRGQ
jgi:phage terminase large subunit GpA-like protein